jgi:hypothetical protein
VIPSNAVIVETMVDVVTPLSAGGVIQVGKTGAGALLMPSNDVLATVAGQYSSGPQNVAWGATAAPVLISVGGAPAAGAGFVLVHYAMPDV